MECLFCQIAAGKIPAKIQYADEQVVAFEDIHPRAPVHLLLIPRQHISTLNDLTPQEAALVGHIVYSAAQLAKQHQLADNGYRLVSNCNSDAGQSVFHIHFHLLGGRLLGWPPG